MEVGCEPFGIARGCGRVIADRGGREEQREHATALGHGMGNSRSCGDAAQPGGESSRLDLESRVRVRIAQVLSVAIPLAIASGFPLRVPA